MGLFGSDKSEEDKQLERVAKCLDAMQLQEKDGLLHAGLFNLDFSIMSGDGKDSQIVDGVLEFMQKQGYEIVDVKFSEKNTSYGFTFLVLYR